jgi:hypothetical protein
MRGHRAQTIAESVVKLSRLLSVQEAKRYRANAAASGEPTLEGPVVEEIAMKLAQVQEKNEALNSEKLRLEGYLRTAKKVRLVPATSVKLEHCCHFPPPPLPFSSPFQPSIGADDQRAPAAEEGRGRR